MRGEGNVTTERGGSARAVTSPAGTVTNGSAGRMLPPANLRSDQIIFRGTRLPYAKFPRNPLL